MRGDTPVSAKHVFWVLMLIVVSLWAGLRHQDPNGPTPLPGGDGTVCHQTLYFGNGQSAVDTYTVGPGVNCP